jgi:MEMO1 family protein
MSECRSACVAGFFYPAEKKSLLDFLAANIHHDDTVKNAIALVMPHAGYVYSGLTAAKTISEVRVPDTVVLLGPNHTGCGTEFSIMSRGKWQMPLGNVPVNEALARSLVEACGLLTEDSSAHLREHSLEVELPFLYYCNSSLSIVPITIASQDFAACEKLAEAIAQVIRGKDILLVASTDMTHYEEKSIAEKKDSEAIEAIKALDEKKLAQTVSARHISMCGFIPVFITILAAKALGARSARLVDYRTSGDASGDYEKVVGYAGMVIE